MQRLLAVDAAAHAEAEALAAVAAVVGQVALAEAAGLETVAAVLFGALAGNDEAAVELGMAGYGYLKAVVAGIQAGLFAGAEVVGVGFALAVFGVAGEAVADGDLDVAVELFAAVAFTVLRGGDVEVAGGQADALAFHPGAVEGGVGAADEFGAAAAAADVAVAVGGTLAVAFAPAVVAAAGEADADAVADGEGDAGVPAGLAAAPGFVALFAGGFEYFKILLFGKPFDKFPIGNLQKTFTFCK